VPEKKPLVRHEAPEELKAKVRRESMRKTTNPYQVLNEFQGPDGNI
jgi:hypothetical protein